MRHAEWKKLLEDPVVLKAQAALRIAKEELASDPFWTQMLTRLVIFPDARRKNRLLLVTDLPAALTGQSAPIRHEVAWDTIACASPEETKAILLAELLKFAADHPI